MATPSLNPPMNLPLLPVTPLPPPSSSSSPPPALTVAHHRRAAVSEIQHQRPQLPPPSSASGDMVLTVEEEEEGGEQGRDEAKLQEQWLRKMQGWLMVLATLVASVTYSAGLNVPGGYWQDDSPSSSNKTYAAGNPVLAVKSPGRYRVFFAFNANAFVMSIVVIVLLLNRSYFHSELRLLLLLGSLLGCLISLVAAFCAGSTRDLVDVLIIVFMLVFGFSWLLCWASVMKRKSSTTRSNVEPRDDVELGTMRQQP